MHKPKSTAGDPTVLSKRNVPSRLVSVKTAAIEELPAKLSLIAWRRLPLHKPDVVSDDATLVVPSARNTETLCVASDPMRSIAFTEEVETMACHVTLLPLYVVPEASFCTS